MSPAVRVERLEGAVTRLVLDRPDRMNSLTPEGFAELRDTVRGVATDGTRAVVLTGAGDRAFSAGYDLARIGELPELSVREFLDLEDVASGALAAVHRLPVPVVAAVNGAAVGGGLSLALVADLRIAADTARFSAAFVTMGLSVGELGTSWLLPRIVGPGVAAELAFTGRQVTAGEALELGLVNRVVPAAGLQDEALALARAIAAGHPGIGKRSLTSASTMASYRDALEAALGDRP